MFRGARSFGAFGPALVLLLGAATSALAQPVDCARLHQELTQAARGSGDARYRDAAERQQSEIERTIAYARSLQCGRAPTLFFGGAADPRCAGVDQRLAAMQANLNQLRARAGAGAGDPGRAAALRRSYEAWCSPRAAPWPAPSPSPGLFESPGEPPAGLRRVPLGEPETSPEETLSGPEAPPVGSRALCVRSCDGGYFPVSIPARRDNLDALGDLCKALCPNVEAKLYTSARGDLSDAISTEGEPYSRLRNAWRFQKKFDSACVCKPPGRSWSEALAEAERLLVEKQGARDPAVPALPPFAETGARRPAPALRPTTPPEPSKPGTIARGQGETREVIGPDGVRRKVRIIAPDL